LIQLDTASGTEFLGHIQQYLTAAGINGTVKGIPIKVVAADATPQVLELVSLKPDFVFIYGVAQTSILTMKAMQQYGLNIPTVAITYLGTPGVYENIGKDAGKNYTFVSCFTPSSSDEKASVALVAAAKKYGHAALTDDINFVSGWVAGQLVTEALQKVGPEPTREKLVDMLNTGFEIDTKGLSSQLKYTPTDHAGLQVLKAFGYDYDAKRFKAFGDYKDYSKYLK
jgi:branched-chain amino acid transport system substrate-binding protein